jgi:hypothetical protein
MDVRDLVFWHKEAQKKLIRDRMSTIQACRLAFAKDNAYSEMMNSLQRQLNELEFGKERVVNESWKALKIMGRG